MPLKNTLLTTLTPWLCEWAGTTTAVSYVQSNYTCPSDSVWMISAKLTLRNMLQPRYRFESFFKSSPDNRRGGASGMDASSRG